MYVYTTNVRQVDSSTGNAWGRNRRREREDERMEYIHIHSCICVSVSTEVAQVSASCIYNTIFCTEGAKNYLVECHLRQM